jgi:AcrR family transcriptional regulator
MENKISAPSARQRLLLTAHALFYREGIRATGIDRIIKEAGVTKVTFYRHFTSKNALIQAYLEFRHELWMTWFKEALNRHAVGSQSPIDTLANALAEWFRDENYRGCAFINAVVELDGTLPEVAEIARRHKMEMTEVLTDLLKSNASPGKAKAVALVIDGAIVRAQMDGMPDHALMTLTEILHSI